MLDFGGNQDYVTLRFLCGCILHRLPFIGQCFRHSISPNDVGRANLLAEFLLLRSGVLTFSSSWLSPEEVNSIVDNVARYELFSFIMRPSSLEGGRILLRTLSVRLSVCLSVRPVSGCTLFTVAPSYERTSKIEKLRFSLMGQRHVCTFRHAQRAAYRTAISAAQILVSFISFYVCTPCTIL